MKKGKIKDRLSPFEKTAYSFASLGREVSNLVVASFSMMFLTTYVGLNGVLVGIMICIAKMCDAFIDPMIAAVVNNTNTKWGRYKPWIAGGALVNVVSIALLFLPLSMNVGVVLKYIYYFSFYMLWGMSFTCVDVPFWALIPAITNSTEEKNSVVSLAKLFAGIGGVIVGSGGTLIITNLVPNGSANRWAYFIVSLIMCAVFLAFLSLVLIFIKEKYPQPITNIKFKEVFSTLKTNDQLIAYAKSFLLYSIGSSIALTQLMYLFLYDYHHLYFGLYIIFNIVACTGQGIVMIFYPLLVKKSKGMSFTAGHIFWRSSASLPCSLSFSSSKIWGMRRAQHILSKVRNGTPSSTY